MPDNVAAVSGSGPSFVSLEPDPDAVVGGDHALMCVDRASEGAEGASGAGADALVRRFTDTSGAGGGSGYLDSPEQARSSCGDDALRAIAACGATALLASGTAGVALLVSGTSCAGNLAGFLECLASEDAASKP